jgi:chaperonin GroEL
MIPKNILYGEEGRKKLLDGATKLAEAVKVTLGPSGRTVLISHGGYGSMMVTKDGVTVANNISLKDLAENEGATMIKRVAKKTNDEAGDGTTTATILAEHIFKQGMKKLSSGSNSTEIRRGIEKATAEAMSFMKEMSRQVTTKEDLLNIARISSNYDEEIGKIVSDVVWESGKEGAITLEESGKENTTYEIVDGFKWDKGFETMYYANTDNDGKPVAEHGESLVVLLHDNLERFSSFIPFLEYAVDKEKPILLVSDGVSVQVMEAFLNNMRKNSTIKIVSVKSPSFGDMRKEYLEDLATLTGAKILGKEHGRNISQFASKGAGNRVDEVIGKISSMAVDQDGTTITAVPDKKQLEKRIVSVRKNMENTNSDFEKEKMQERIARLRGGVAVIRVGGTTEEEMKEKKMRVEDAINATKAAYREGILPGGGISYIRVLSMMKEHLQEKNLSDDQKIGYDIVMDALTTPLLCIVGNSGKSGEAVLDRLLELEDNMGYDAREHKYVDMYESGIVDPFLVSSQALKNASSVAGLALTTECVITEDLEELQKMAGGAPFQGA